VHIRDNDRRLLVESTSRWTRSDVYVTSRHSRGQSTSRWTRSDVYVTSHQYRGKSTSRWTRSDVYVPSRHNRGQSDREDQLVCSSVTAICNSIQKEIGNCKLRRRLALQLRTIRQHQEDLYYLLGHTYCIWIVYTGLATVYIISV
jgi:hypothetical protein